MKTQSRKTIVIEYCTGCRWLLRSSWMAQEILTTFEKECVEVCLRPCPDQAGHFQVFSDQFLIWCRKRDQGFPELKILKQKIRNHMAPDKDLGHSDSKN